MRTLEERLARLERANRRWRYGAGLLAIVVLVGLTGAANKSNDIVEVLRQLRRAYPVKPELGNSLGRVRRLRGLHIAPVGGDTAQAASRSFYLVAGSRGEVGLDAQDKHGL